MQRLVPVASLIALVLTPAPVRSENWSGLYFGVSAGLGMMTAEHGGASSFLSAFDARDTGYSIGPGNFREDYVFLRSEDASQQTDWQGSNRGDLGAAAGILLGTNVRLGRFVLGGELNMDWLDFSNEATVQYLTVSSWQTVALQSVNGGAFHSIQDDLQRDETVQKVTVGTQIDWRTSAVARAGASLSEQWLAYGLVGYARAGFTDAPFETRNGVILGGGVEWAVNDGWSMRLKYRHTRFEDWTSRHETVERYSGPTFSQTIRTSTVSTFDATTDEVKLGLTYQFQSFTP